MQEKETLSKEEHMEEEERERREKKKKKKEESRTEPVKRKPETTLPRKEKRVSIPFMKLEVISKSELTKLKVNSEISKIKKEKREISLPFMELRKPSLSLRRHKLDSEELQVKKTPRILHVPIIRVRSSPRLSSLLTEFDAKIREPPEPISPKIRVPIYRKAISTLPRLLLESFDLVINEQLKDRLEKKEEIDRTLPIERIGAKKLEAMASTPSAEEEEIPDFLEFAFGSGGGRIRVKGPKIILFRDFEDDSYIGFLENLCLRIYREREGGEPKAIKIRKMDEMNKREVERYLEADGKIFTVDFEDSKIPDETHLWERLEETYTERLGFIIFTVRNEEKFEHLRRLLQKLNHKAQGRLSIIELEARRLPLELIRLSSGMIDLTKPPIEVKVDKIPTITTFDYIFNMAFFNEESAFNKVLEDIKNEERGLFKESTNPAEEIESSLHFNVKVFLVRYLTHMLRKEGKKLSARQELMREIETENELIPEEVIPDVKVGGEVYEVETLFGPHAGEEPDLKINKTVDKYDKTSGITRVSIIMDNFGFLLHLKDLLRKREHFRSKTFDVEFHTLDLQNGKLVSLADFAKHLISVLSLR